MSVTTRLFIDSSIQKASNRNRPYFIVKSQNERDAYGSMFYPTESLDGWFGKSISSLWYFRNPEHPNEKDTYVSVGGTMEFWFFGMSFCLGPFLFLYLSLYQFYCLSRKS